MALNDITARNAVLREKAYRLADGGGMYLEVSPTGGKYWRLKFLAVLKRIDSRGARFTAHRVHSEISRVFRYAIKEGKAKSDPAKDLIGAIPPAVAKLNNSNQQSTREAITCA